MFQEPFAVLDSAGLTAGDMVNVNVYLIDMGDFQAMNEVYAKHFSEPYPARTTELTTGRQDRNRADCKDTSLKMAVAMSTAKGQNRCSWSFCWRGCALGEWSLSVSKIQ